MAERSEQLVPLAFLLLSLRLYTIKRLELDLTFIRIYCYTILLVDRL